MTETHAKNLTYPLKGEQLLREFTRQFGSGAQGCEMDCDAAKELCTAIVQALENSPAGLADATNDPASLSSLRKDAVGPAVSEGGRSHSAPVTSGAEVAVKDAASDLLFHLELYDFSERDPSGELNEKMADLKAALVSGSREDGADA